MPNPNPRCSIKTTKGGDNDGDMNRPNRTEAFGVTGENQIRELINARKRPAVGQKPSQIGFHSQYKASPRSYQQGLEAYIPLQRWMQEDFREQPWHGIARERMTDGRVSEYLSVYQGEAEASVSQPCKGGDRRGPGGMDRDDKDKGLGKTTTKTS